MEGNAKEIFYLYSFRVAPVENGGNFLLVGVISFGGVSSLLNI